MKNQTQASRKIKGQASVSQEQTNSGTPSEKPQAEHQTIVPSEVAQATLKVLSELEIAIQAAVALVMMNADMIKQHACSHADWEDLTLNGFKEGVLIVARIACEQLRKTFRDWDMSQHEFIAPLLDVAYPLPAIQDRDSYSLALNNRQSQSFDSFTEFENARDAIDYLLHMQGWIMEPRDSTHAFQLCDPVREKLKVAWESASTAYRELLGAFAAVEVAKMNGVQH